MNDEHLGVERGGTEGRCQSTWVKGQGEDSQDFQFYYLHLKQPV